MNMSIGKQKTSGEQQKKFSQWFENTGITYLMILPNFILFLAFVVYPILWTVRFMFYNYDGVIKADFVGIENFVRAMQDELWWSSVWNTFKLATMKLVIEIPLAMVLAVILNGKIRGRGFFRGVFFLPTVTSMATMSLAFSFMFSPYNGIVNMLLKKWGLITENISFLEKPTSAFMTIVVISIWSVFGQNMLLFLSGLQNVPEDVYESAMLDGANKVQIFFKITIPMIRSVFTVVLMLAIIGSLGMFDSVYLITGGGPSHATEVMATKIYGHYFTSGTVPQYGYGAALGFISSVIIGIVTLIYLRITKEAE